MRAILFLTLMFLLPGLTATAGAWPREKGKVFVAVSQSFSMDDTGRPDGYQSLFMEYGFSEKLTFGAKLWRRADGRHGDVLAFARYPVGPTDGKHKFALGLALGVRAYGDGTYQPVVQPEFAWGRGFESPLGHGWMSFEAAAGRTIGGEDQWYKADFTIGVKPNDKTHLMLQLRGFSEPEGDVAVLAPSYVRKITKGTNLEIGMTYRFGGENRIGALFGTWIEF